METTTGRSSLFSLFKSLTTDTKAFIRQEVQLAKTELSEKVSCMGRNVAVLAIGGFVAYAGLIVLFVGLGWLAGHGLQKAGLEAALANGAGIGGVGLLIAIIGVILLFKGLNTLKQTSLTPERTMHTLHELKGQDHREGMEYALAHAGGAHAIEDEEEEDHKASAEELQSQVEATEERVGETLDEIGRRFNPSHIKAEVANRISAEPYRFGMIAMGVGVVSGLIVHRKLFGNGKACHK